MNNKYAKELCHSQFQGEELYHHGILGMHWGIRRYQPYPDGYKGDGKYVGKEYKADKKKLRELTNAVIRQDIYRKYAEKKRDKAQIKNIKRPSQKREQTYELWDEVNKNVEKNYDELLSKAERFNKDMKNKYSNMKVKDLEYKVDKHGKPRLYVKNRKAEIILAAFRYPATKEGLSDFASNLLFAPMEAFIINMNPITYTLGYTALSLGGMAMDKILPTTKNGDNKIVYPTYEYAKLYKESKSNK